MLSNTEKMILVNSICDELTGMIKAKEQEIARLKDDIVHLRQEISALRCNTRRDSE
jgi:hypothetical protein